jgi:hypothetical protein
MRRLAGCQNRIGSDWFAIAKMKRSLTMLRQRRPRVIDEAHRKFIASLPCIICGDDTTTECAHVSMPDLSIAKPVTAMASKAHDHFTVPLCGMHHREQHSGNERAFWKRFGIDPHKKALALFAARGDYEQGCAIVRAAAA